MVVVMQMEALKFTLAGKSAFFKKPDVNTKIYFTYNNIHKVALLGLLGAVTGLSGYYKDEATDKKGKPEFYSSLCNLKVSVVPNAYRGYFTKKIQYFNNSTGYASDEEGGNLQVFEQWLENPCWTIYIYNGGISQDLWNKLCDYIQNNKCVYIPYLGKNDHPAVITDAEMIKLEPVQEDHVDSLFPGSLDLLDDTQAYHGRPYIFTEYAPYALEDKYNFYLLKRFIYTNCLIKQTIPDTFRYNELVLAFY
jgi:CRISPR-associated protein Cas5h